MTTPSPTLPAPAPTSPVDELARRWKLARFAALRGIVPSAPLPLEEAALVQLAAAQDADAALKAVFDNGRVLGLGFRRYYKVDLTMVDLGDLLPALGVPCHATGFVRAGDDAAWRSQRAPCTQAPSPALCAHWRESILGLVGGISTAVRYTRCESPGTGGDACVDLLHIDPETPLRFSPVGEELQATLDAATRLVHRINPSAKLVFLGILEGALHYRLQAVRGACGSCASSPADADEISALAGVAMPPGGGLDVATVLQQFLLRRVPSLRLCDATPHPVFSESP